MRHMKDTHLETKIGLIQYRDFNSIKIDILIRIWRENNDN